jgi:hypothetical protein
MSTQHTHPSDPFLLVLARKLVLLVLLMITSAIGLVALLRQVQITIPVLAFLLSDSILGLAAGCSARWILPRKSRVLRVGSATAFVTGGLALLGWFTGWSFGIELFRSSRSGLDWWGVGQLFLAIGFALLALFAWQHPIQAVVPAVRTKAARKVVRPRQRPQKKPKRTPISQPAAPAIALAAQPAKQEIATRPVKPKRRRTSRSKPRLVLSAEEEHRCPYCLELVEPGDRRGVVECEICHTLHHADCWAITGACQVPHFTA